MKKLIKITLVAAFVMIAYGLFAQSPPHPNGGNAPSGANTPVGGGAPIDGGITMLLLMGAAYGSKKIFKSKKINNNLK